ncbi:DUF6387 family protein [Steroidobacter flavus]|uniref:DUF6387 family protein n=1 Tax=Steroidobacter flavus TaxID=1842136 RepID=A0ABV8SQ62_9GAMM
MKISMPDWYPLETYQRRLSAEEWASELYIRLGLRIAYRNCKAMVEEHAGPIRMGRDQSSPEETFIAVLSDQAPSRKGRFIFDDEPDLSRDWPINALTAFEAEFLAHLLRPYANPEHIAWAQRLALHPELRGEFSVRKEGGEIVEDRESSWDKLPPNMGLLCRDILGARVPLMVNLNLDDESLKTAFEVWLLGMRQQLGGVSKAAFDGKDFKKWHEFKVLQVFDLDLWMEIKGINIKDVVIGRELWPEGDPQLGDFDRTDRLRKVTREINERLFTPWECERLIHQIRLIKFVQSVGGAIKKDSLETTR